VSQLADDSLKPPLTRRVPGAARSGPRSMTRPILPEALLKRMQAAVDAARATRDREQAQPGRAVRGPMPVTQVERGVFSEISRPAPAGTATPQPAASEAVTPEAVTPEAVTPEAVTPEAVTPSLPVQIWPPAETSLLVTSPVVTSPPVTSPPVTSPPVTIPAVTSAQETRRPLAARPPRRPTPHKPRRRGPRVAGAAALAVILFTAGAVSATLWSRATGAAAHSSRADSTTQPNSSPHSSPSHTSPPPSTQSPNPAAVTANLAATWVAAQVSHNAYVACDRAMCDALTAQGFPGRKLQLIRPKSSYPLHAQVVVETPLVARQFGNSAAAKWAPAVLTRLGSGPSAILIRIVSPKGGAAYSSLLRRDVQRRKTAAHQLLVSPHVKVTAEARNELAQGQVDARLIVVLTALAAVHPIDILGFGTNFAGATPGMPLRLADLAPNDAASGMKAPEYLGFLRNELGKQPTTYRPQSYWLGHDSTGKPIFIIKFAAPSPLLILGT